MSERHVQNTQTKFVSLSRLLDLLLAHSLIFHICCFLYHGGGCTSTIFYCVEAVYYFSPHHGLAFAREHVVSFRVSLIPS
jgi:hypothetical protein